MKPDVEVSELLFESSKSRSSSAVTLYKKIEALLEAGADPSGYFLGESLTSLAFRSNRFDIVELLISYGASINQCIFEHDINNARLASLARNPEEMERFLSLGAKFADFTEQDRELYLKHRLTINENIYFHDNSSFGPVRGEFNAQRVNNPFRLFQIVNFMSSREARGIIQEGDAEYDVASKVFSFQRVGRSWTYLPNGDVFLIGGSHEDFYDKDHFIYNDVTIFKKNGEVLFYDYPVECLAPVFHHSVTLVDNQLYIITGAGFSEQLLQVYCLSLADLRCRKVVTSNDCREVIPKHQAEYKNGTIHLFTEKNCQKVECAIFDPHRSMWVGAVS